MSYSRLLRGFVLVGIMSIALLAGTSAKAAREINDFEARKLTFSALIAPPVRHHYKSRSKYHRSRRSYALASRKKNRSVIRRVTYRGRVVTHHKRNRHHRRG
ncbi:hypothetical protein [Aristophania vespae]|uniref:hypothetical protein n=1 Tax=Aristophania vespae TaxID=2697033 RepID=UPI00235176D0|nr:hypothetical protein [Aristophania vespae]UMM63064.1 hypothetical protein DM15PD_00170 [Aristophania vespae]